MPGAFYFVVGVSVNVFELALEAFQGVLDEFGILIPLADDIGPRRAVVEGEPMTPPSTFRRVDEPTG